MMTPEIVPGSPVPELHAMDEAELRLLFHRLNNQLGIILSHAELLEAKSGDAMNRSRASQVISSALEAMNTAKAIRLMTVRAAD